MTRFSHPTPDEFRTLARECRTEIKVKSSRFLSHAGPCPSMEIFEDRLQAARKTYFDATHHCSACRIGTGSSQIGQMHDDGEPSGTAGRPILQSIQSRGLTNVFIIVTRYFGGTKLGTGGLARAYRSAADAALLIAELKVEILRDMLGIRFRYDELAAVMRIVDKSESLVGQTEYSDVITMHLGVRRSLREEVQRQLIDATRGQVEFL